MRASNRVIQNYFKWNEGLFAEAKHHMDHLFNGEPYVGIHLRTGIDWVSLKSSLFCVVLDKGTFGESYII